MAETRYYAPYRPEGLNSPSEHSNALPAHFRRSVSIFSRKGTETPEPTLPFISQAAMRGSSHIVEKQKSWKLGRAMSVKSTASHKSSNSPKTPTRGTILNAVPPAKTVRLTRLEEEMATSPNDEILTAISEHAPTLDALNGSQPASPVQPSLSRRRSNPTLSPRARSQKKRERLDSRVGVWVDGVVHWDSAIFIDDETQDQAIDDTGFIPIRPLSAGNKPQLSVVIPGGEPSINDQALSKILQPQPRRAVVSVAPISLNSRFSKSMPCISDEKEVSPAQSDAAQSMTPPARPHAPLHPSEEKQVVSRNSTSSSSGNTDSGSGSSRRSSATSVEVYQTAPTCGKDKPLPPLPASEEEASTSAPVYRPYRPAHSVRLMPSPRRLHSQKVRQSRSISELDSCDRQFMRTSPYKHSNKQFLHISPTLSQAEEELEDQLATMSPQTNDEPNELEDTSPKRSSSGFSGVVRRKSSVSDVMSPPARAPTIPKRSRKRDWRATGSSAKKDGFLLAPKVPTRRRSDSQMNQSLENEATPQSTRRSISIHVSQKSVDSTSSFDRPSSSDSADAPTSQTESKATSSAKAADEPVAETSWLDIESDSEAEADDEVTLPETIPEADESAASTVPSASAENVLLGILSSLQCQQDLFNTAIINKGMYRVYKENEMELLRIVSYNESAPAWELREWSPPDKNEVDSGKASSLLDHTPLSYQRCHRRDRAVIERLKRLISEKCQTFIRRETAFALSTPTHPNASRYDDAFWRIWCFCKIFGCDKGREDDITGQLDWLKGGVLATNQGCVATVNTNLDFDMSSVLLNAPDYFAKANLGGMSASQLFDMTEIWTCMHSLLQGYQGRVDQARQYGVFDALDIEEDDVEKEEQAIEEWTAYLLTLGPHVVLDMAERALDPEPAGFEFADWNGWTDWAPPIYNNGTRTTFLKEPVSKSYEEQMIMAKIRHQDPVEQEMKERSRQRVATLAQEIRLRRQSSEYKRLPLIDMKNERAMSVFSRRGSNASARSHVSRASRRNNTAPASSSSAALWQPPKKISRIVEEANEYHPNHRQGLQILADGIVEDTSEKAVKTIVNMGFTVSEAREALRMTDMGDGIRLQRAVELLLRRQRN